MTAEAKTNLHGRRQRQRAQQLGDQVGAPHVVLPAIRLLTVKQVSAQLGISLSLVYELCKAGVIRCTRHGRPGKRGCIRIAENSIAEYLEACRPPDPTPLRHLR
jgi:excisionase family DNA binding protein